jgi:hypothetical protein
MSNEKKLTIRNDAHDFLVFTQENGGDGIDVLAADENVWLTQKLMCQLYHSSKSNISEHLTAIFENAELDPVQLFGISEQLHPKGKNARRSITIYKQ